MVVAVAVVVVIVIVVVILVTVFSKICRNEVEGLFVLLHSNLYVLTVKIKLNRVSRLVLLLNPSMPFITDLHEYKSKSAN
ncbi:hypothetical protein BDF20DRAFT_881612 [Mycotypha africana]|uniref:uncharacterized protein n=1 Tax=Mycotypha africana TaxID=64632 RepID=UPI0022FFC753|nr:uncharacterized protein BDF20DRAFT_881612 [Mycotypha africana]KAI8973299.1 hypothetical protein BDF20DRAFT_881612 [Mycotypha africana]